MIVAYAAGGGTDVSFRLLAKYAEEYAGVPLVVENRPGAGGEIGFTAIATAEPDGYTIGGINAPTFMAIAIERETKYSLESFDPIIEVMNDPCITAVKYDSKFNSLDDIVSEAKTADMPFLTYGISGTGGDDHLALIQFQDNSNVEFITVPFPGGAPTRAALLGGHITMWGGNLGEAIGLHEAQELRILGIMAKERNSFAPNIPTFNELGYPVYMSSSRGIAAPKGMDKEKLNFLIEIFSKAMNTPDFIKEANNLKLPLGNLKGEEYRNSLEEEYKTLEKIWKESPWK